MRSSPSPRTKGNRVSVAANFMVELNKSAVDGWLVGDL